MKNHPSGAFTDLPVIIDGPGRYKTRKGQTAYVDKVRTTNSTPNMPPPTFAAMGHVEHKTARGSHSEFTTWHVSGRNAELHERSSDIIGKD